MGFLASDVIPLSTARANFSELAEEVRAGAEKIITKNGESYVALIDADRLGYYHRLERERIHLLLIDDAKCGLADIAAADFETASDEVVEQFEAFTAGWNDQLNAVGGKRLTGWNGGTDLR